MARMVRVAKYLLSCYWSSSNDLEEEDTKRTIAIQNMINHIIIGTINQQWKHLMKPSCSKSQLERGIDQ